MVDAQLRIMRIATISWVSLYLFVLCVANKPFSEEELERRWIVVSNPSLCALIPKWLGTEAWIRDVDLLTGLRAYAADPGLQQEWMMVLSRLHICTLNQ
ncbi:hypothetical protein ACE6H2_028497 [Prunus campanulata]